MAIPEGWEEARLEEVCLEKGQYGANSPKQSYDPLLPRYVRITDIDSEGRLKNEEPVSIDWVAAEGHILSDGDILLARSGATVGKSYLHRSTAIPCAFAGYLIRFRPVPARLIPEFLAQYLYTPTYWKWVADTQRAQAQPNINAAEYGSLLVPLPPLPEQRKIAAILSSVDAVIAKTEAVIAQLQIVKKAMMEELLTKGMPGRHTRFKQTEIGEIPEEWEVVQIGEIGFVQAGRQRNPSATGKPRPYLRVANVFDGRIDVDDVLEMPFTDDEFLRYQLRSGDVLLNEGQSIELVGRCSAYHGELGVPCAFQNTLIRFQAGPRVLWQFAVQLFRWMQISGAFAEVATQTTSIAHLGVSRFAGMRIKIPQLREQQQILAVLEGIDRTLDSQRRESIAIRTLKSALSSSLLSGELRVIPEVAE